MPQSSDRIVLLSKQSGMTSFSSLWQIKNAMDTRKIGHTGTLDTFAEGLLVAVSGQLTRLVSHITDCDKVYEALLRFGATTDTLDPDGTVTETAPLPTLQAVLSVLPSFTGPIMQRPPEYSAVHVGGQRASARMRSGESVEIPERPVTIHAIEFLFARDDLGRPIGDADPAYEVALRVTCSKGTYIRSLARDIASAVGSRAYLASLRRTRIGPFALECAAGYGALEPFGARPPAKYGVGAKPPEADPSDIIGRSLDFNPVVSASLGLPALQLSPESEDPFLHGRPISRSWLRFTAESDASIAAAYEKQAGKRFTVFSGERFCGIVFAIDGRLSYEAVAGAFG
jgi:tRNA pseudouridine55 synthase